MRARNVLLLGVGCSWPRSFYTFSHDFSTVVDSQNPVGRTLHVLRMDKYSVLKPSQHHSKFIAGPTPVTQQYVPIEVPLPRIIGTFNELEDAFINQGILCNLNPHNQPYL